MVFKAFALMFASFVLGSVSFAAEPAPGAVSPARLEDAMNYQNGFATIGELVDDLFERGLINAEEKAGIERLIVSLKAERSSAMPQGATEGTTAKWGKLSVAFQEDGALKTEDGRLLRVRAGDAKDRIFGDTVKAVLGEKTVFRRLMLPEAHARDIGDAFAAIGVGFLRVLTTVATLFALPVCGIPAMSADGIIHATKVMLRDGKVSCRGGRYVSTGFDAFGESVKRDYRVGKSSTVKLTFSGELDAAFYALCAAPVQRMLPGGPSREKTRPVAPETVRKALGGRAPACTKENAAKVERHLKDNAARIAKAVKDAENQRKRKQEREWMERAGGGVH